MTENSSLVNETQDGPLISVMIPVYNRSGLLEEALNSVLVQYPGDNLMEVWVVDDHSLNDLPDEVVDKVGKGKVKLFRQEKNVGQIRNLNTCISLAKGKLVHLLHCDDLVLPGFYSAVIKAYNETPSAGAFFTRNQVIDHDGVLITTSEPLQDHSGIIENWFEKIAVSQYIQTPSIVVKKEVYESIGSFNQNLTWTEDWEMWVRIAKNYPVYFINEILASYREANNSNSAESFRSGRFIVDLRKVIEENYRHHGSAEWKKRSEKNYANYIFFMIDILYQQKKVNRSSIRKLLRLFLKEGFYSADSSTYILKSAKIYLKTFLR